MKTSRFSDAQVIAILKLAESSSPVPELCRDSLMARLKKLEEGNRRLKKMYAEERLKAEIIAEAMAKKW